MEDEIYTNQDPLELEMEDENGEKVRVKIVRLFDDNNKHYVVANNLNNDESYIFEIIPHDDGDELISIASEEEFNRLCDIVDTLEDEEE